jgi:hypothetical protein
LNELHNIALRLAELGKKKPSAAARREVAEALTTKAEGIRVNAMKVLAAWGDDRALDELKRLLVENIRSGNREMIQVIVRLLIPHIAKLDRGEVIELYFSTDTWMIRHLLTQLLYAFPLKGTASMLATRYRAGKNASEIPKLLDNMQFYALTHRRKD